MNVNNYINKDNIYCTNCGKNGHLFKKCNQPITSLGIITIKITGLNKLITNCKKSKQIYYNWDDVKLLMIRRKNSLGFVEIIRGRYSINNITQIQRLFRQMIPEEIDLIKKESFSSLWKFMWNKKENYHNFEKSECSLKFETLKQMLPIILKNIKSEYSFAEWGFPKGRRNNYEKNLSCAIREFHEETGIPIKNITLLHEIPVLEEVFYGTNKVKYKHIYYSSWYPDNINMNLKNYMQCNEIGDIRWVNVYEAIDLVKDRRIEKRNLILSIFNQIQSLFKYYNIIIKDIPSNVIFPKHNEILFD